MRALGKTTGNERGAAIVLFAVGLAAMFAFMALAIDLAMMLKARNDAQRAADAAALAGASAFLNFSPAAAVAPARQRALEYALRNTFLNGPIDTSEVYIGVFPDSFYVGVYVYKDSVPTWFARTLGKPWVPIGAFAAAVAADAGAAKCLKPFAVPDAWHDPNGDTNGDLTWQSGETWLFGDHPGDFYLPYSGPSGPPNETGYGSAWRNFTTPFVADYGRQLVIKYQDPNNMGPQAQPGIFLPWRLPQDPNMPDCDRWGGGSQPQGGATYRKNICECNTSVVTLSGSYDLEPGNMIGPTFQGLTELLGEDPGAYWDQSAKMVRNSAWGANWLQSPRVIKVAMFAPQIQKPGMQSITFNNFGLLFVEDVTRRGDVTGRFLYYVSGSGEPGAVTGSLVKVLQLVK